MVRDSKRPRLLQNQMIQRLRGLMLHIQLKGHPETLWPFQSLSTFPDSDQISLRSTELKLSSVLSQSLMGNIHLETTKREHSKDYFPNVFVHETLYHDALFKIL